MTVSTREALAALSGTLSSELGRVLAEIDPTDWQARRRAMSRHQYRATRARNAEYLNETRKDEWTKDGDAYLHTPTGHRVIRRYHSVYRWQIDGGALDYCVFKTLWEAQTEITREYDWDLERQDRKQSI